MRIHQITAFSFVVLLAALAAGCSTMTANEAADVRKSFGLPADMPLKDLGVVELHAGIPKRVSAGWGKDCTLTAIMLTNGLVQLNLLYESKGEVIDGVKTQPYSEQSRMVFRPGRKGWGCFPPMRPYFVVAVQAIIIP